MHLPKTFSNLFIHGSTFNEIHGDSYTYNYHNASSNVGPNEPGLTKLFKASAKDAAYDSLGRHPPSKCHPGTRLDIIATLERWITGTEGPGIFWLHGPAGSGKSAIAQTICELSAERNHLLASFFFMRGSPDRGTIKNFIPTLAFQVGTSRTDLRQHIGNAAETELAILHRSISKQLLKLIIEPLRSSTPSQSAPFLLVVDGLDECKGKDHQLQILSHMTQWTTKYHLPVRCLIVSRPEPHIKHFFDVSISQNTSTGFSIYGSRAEYSDVYKFLRSKFDEISTSERHASALARIRVHASWPPDDIVQLLAKKSDGYFIYASTLVNYIDDEFSPCTKRLEEVLQTAGTESVAFAELDKLYTQILSTCPNIQLLSRVLGCLIILPTYNLDQNLQTIELVLELCPGEGMTILRGLHAVLSFRRETVKPIHASLSDFLFDESRSNKFYIDPQRCHVDIVLHILRSITNWEPKEWNTNPSRFWIFGKWVFTIGFKHLSDQHIRTLIEYITQEWNPDFWRAFLLKTREWHAEGKGHLFGIIHKMTQMFKEMSGRYPNLLGYDDDFLLLAFEAHCPVPTSVDDARCMQNAYTILRGASNRKQTYMYPSDRFPLILSISEPIGGASKQVVEDFQLYMVAFKACAGWEFLDDVMGDPKKCGALYCDVGTRNARIAQRYMTILVAGEPDVAKTGGVVDVVPPERRVEYGVAETFWSYHLLSSPPGDPTLTSLLRTLTPWSTSDVSSHLHTEHASRIVEWLKKSQDPPAADLVARWQSLATPRHSYAGSQRAITEGS